MHKLSIGSFFLFLAIISNAQDFTPGNPSRNRNVIDAKEVRDPSSPKKDFTPKNYDASDGLKNLPYSQGTNFFLSRYPILGFVPKTNFSDSFNLAGLSGLKLVDARFDNEKVGFSPVGYYLQKKGYTTLGLQIQKNPIDWLKDQLNQKSTDADTGSHRKLTVVMQKFWFSNSAIEPYTATHPKLVTTLHYHFDIYTSLDIGYYPQSKFAGSISALHNEGEAYNVLADSLLARFAKEVFTNRYSAKETEANWVSPVDFNDYYNQRLKISAHPEKIPKGVYATYADFVAGKPVYDSAEMIMVYNNYDRIPDYACQLTGFKERQPQSCNRSWGYYDGSSLYVNTGSGIFIRLVRVKTDFVFFYLKNLREERIKPDQQNSINIGTAPYRVLKDYTKTYRLTYQLDYDTGRLY